MEHLPSRPLAAVGGVGSALFGLGAAELIAGTTTRLRSPILDVGDRAIDLVPVFLKNWAISLFGTNDKTALLVGIGVVIAVYAALIGLLAFRRSTIFAGAGLSLFAVLGGAAALSGRGNPPWWTITPTLVGSTMAAVALVLLTRAFVIEPRGRRLGRPSQSIADLVPNSRRRFLGTTAVLAAAGAGAAAVGRSLEARFGAADSRAAVRLPSPIDQVPEVTEAGFYTANADFYRIDTALTVPQVPTEGWSLDIGGMVDRPFSLSYDELLRRPMIETDITLTCVSNLVGGKLLGTARWLGVRLDDLLADAGIDPAADQIVGRSVDGYTCGFPVDTLDGRDAIVAVAMNGEPLPLQHGFPARLVVPGLYRYVSATKWLSEIELTTFDAFDSYWVPRGYADRAPIKQSSRIDSPTTLSTVPLGPVALGGVAWAQPVGVAKVEVKIDDDDWFEADLGEDVSGNTWRQWQTVWQATPGRHSISVRCTNHDGDLQSADRVDPLPDGATGLHTIVVIVAEA